MKVTYAISLTALLLCSTSLGWLGSRMAHSIEGTVDAQSTTPEIAARSEAAHGTVARVASKTARVATRPLTWTGQRMSSRAAQIGGAAILPVVVRHPELSRLPGLRWSATAANVLDLAPDAGPITAYRKLRPYANQLVTETPMWRAYYSSMRWVKRHLGLSPWEPPSRAPRFDELAYLRAQPKIKPRVGRASQLTWDSTPSPDLPFATLGSVLGEGFANRVWRAELEGTTVAVKARKPDLSRWLDLLTRDQRFAHEVDGASNLHEYLDGPAATIVRFEDDTNMRIGLALELVEGKPLAKFLAGEPTDFSVTQAHLESIERMFAKLDEQGAWLEDLHDGQLMLQADGSVVPIDMRVEPLGDGNPMVLEYARRRAGILDELGKLAHAK